MSLQQALLKFAKEAHESSDEKQTWLVDQLEHNQQIIKKQITALKDLAEKYARERLSASTWNLASKVCAYASAFFTIAIGATVGATTGVGIALVACGCIELSTLILKDTNLLQKTVQVFVHSAQDQQNILNNIQLALTIMQIASTCISLYYSGAVKAALNSLNSPMRLFETSLNASSASTKYLKSRHDSKIEALKTEKEYLNSKLETKKLEQSDNFSYFQDSLKNEAECYKTLFYCLKTNSKATKSIFET